MSHAPHVLDSWKMSHESDPSDGQSKSFIQTNVRRGEGQDLELNLMEEEWDKSRNMFADDGNM